MAEFRPPPPRPQPMRAPPPPPPPSKKRVGNDPASINRTYPNRPMGGVRSGVGGILGAILGVILIIAVLGFIAIVIIFGPHNSTTTTTTTILQTGSGPTTTVAGTTTQNLGAYTYCAAASGFNCSTASYNAGTGMLTVNVSQTSGYPWATANITFVSSSAAYQNITYQGNVYQIPAVSFSSPSADIFSNMQSGQYEVVTLPANGADVVNGYVNVTVWARYTVAYYNGTYYAEIANVSVPT